MVVQQNKPLRYLDFPCQYTYTPCYIHHLLLILMTHFSSQLNYSQAHYSQKYLMNSIYLTKQQRNHYTFQTCPQLLHCLPWHKKKNENKNTYLGCFWIIWLKTCCCLDENTQSRRKLSVWGRAAALLEYCGRGEIGNKRVFKGNEANKGPFVWFYFRSEIGLATRVVYLLFGPLNASGIYHLRGSWHGQIVRSLWNLYLTLGYFLHLGEYFIPFFLVHPIPLYNMYFTCSKATCVSLTSPSSSSHHVCHSCILTKNNKIM